MSALQLFDLENYRAQPNDFEYLLTRRHRPQSIYSLNNQAFRFPVPIWAKVAALVGILLFCVAAHQTLTG